jgi:Ca2+-binding RTX toxin-like protein
MRRHTANHALPILFQTLHNDVTGTASGETLLGTDGNIQDLLNGLGGNDVLRGGGGNDTYLFQDGSGADAVIDSSGKDEVAFQGTLVSSLARFAFANGNRSDLLISFDGRPETVTIQGYFALNGTETIETISFADGHVADPRAIRDAVFATLATPNADVISGFTTSETLVGGAGADTLDGLEGDDTLIGSTGNDTLYGSGGNDTFQFNSGDGADTVIERGGGFYGGNDTIRFGDGIDPADVTVTQSANGQDLILKVNGTTDQITIIGTMVNSDDRVEQVIFADGQVWSHADLVRMSISNDADGTAYGSYDGDTLAGTAGADVLDGREGDDVITGGAGNDTLYGSGGNDTFRFARGHGQDTIIERGVGFYGGNDTIEFMAGVLPTDVTVTQSANGQDLILKINGTTDQVTVKYDMVNSDDRVEQVKFADGTIWSHAQLVQMSINADADGTVYGSYDSETLTGTAGADVLDGREGDDIIIGGVGNDTLYGSGGNDTFRFNRGDGQDVIQERGVGFYGGNDTVAFTAGILPSDVTVTQANSGQDLVLTINGTNDRITIASTMTNSDYRVEQVTFADGTIWTHAQLVQMSIAANSGANTFYGSYDSETLSGGAGNDILDGREGDDILIGGVGNDTLYGSGGNDVFRFARGDGQDFIHERGVGFFGGNDTVEFAAGIAQTDVTVVQADNGHDLILKINGTTDQITLDETLVLSDDKIEFVRFSDGALWTANDLVQRSSGGTAGNDTIFGDPGPNVLDGAGGNDTIDGREGDDVIIGGTGNDVLRGSGGNDVFRFARGDGQDVIQERGAGFYGGNDTLEFVDVLPSDITVTQANSGQDLVVKVNGTTDQITIASTLTNSDYRVEQAKFADGSTLTHAQLVQMSIANNSGNDVFYGSYDGEIVAGGAGDDTLDGMDGSDIIIGGTGNDLLKGSGGNDTFRFARGDGQDIIKERGSAFYGGNDTIEFAPGIAVSDITVTQAYNGYDLVLKIIGTTDQITIQNTMVWTDDRIEQVKFADGAILTHAQLVDMSLANNSGNDTLYGSYDGETINGGPGNDTLDGMDGNDIVIGGTGNDTVKGSGGNDTYRFWRGDGQDVLYERGNGFYGGNDTIEFMDILPPDITVSQANGGLDFILRINGTTDQITIAYTMVYSDYRVEQVKFANGSVLTHAQLVQLSTVNNGGNDVFYGTDDVDTIDGGAGNDTVDTRGGNDTLSGGTGDDSLKAGWGNDSLTGGPGNDSLEGQSGADTYVYNPGDGDDLLIDYQEADSTTDTLVFGAGISAADVVFSHTADSADAKISFANQAGSIVLDYQWWWDGGIENIRFADGTVWTFTDISSRYVSGQTTPGNDTIWGTFGDDIIIGGAGNDTLQGQGGNDIYRFARNDGQDVLKAGAGTDSLEFAAGIATADVTVTRNANDLILKINGTTDKVTLLGTLANSSTQLDQVKFADGTVWTASDLIARAIIDPTIYGTSGNDTIALPSNFITVDGGAGDDIMSVSGNGGGTIVFGIGSGHDTLDNPNSGYHRDDVLALTNLNPADVILRRSGDQLTVSVASTGDSFLSKWQFWGAGIDLGLGRIRFATGVEWDRTAIAAHVTTATSGDDVITGTSGADFLRGLDGNDTLTGGAGDDSVSGEAGNDLIDGGAGNDILDGGPGTDTLTYSSATAAVTVDLSLAIVQNTVGSGSDTVAGIENLTGSAFNDTLTGNASSNTISGAAGNDLIDGGAGDDTLDGGGGTDTVSYASAAAAVILSLATATAQNTGGAGIDTLVAVENINGSAFSDALTGDANANTISGGAGDDQIEGGAGNDTLDGGNGTDTLSYASATAGVTANLALATAQNTVGAGTDTATGFENLTGSGLIDTLTGDANANTISGGAGNDTIDGGLGDDLLDGGAGDDKLTGNTGIDTVSYASATAGVTVNLTTTKAQNTIGAGSDTLATIENLTGSGFNDRLTGSTADNAINGGAGNDVIDGASGNDTLDGGAGNDTLTGNTGTDTVSYASAGSAVTVSLALTTAQNTVGSGSDTIATVENLTGSAFNDTLTGNASANTIIGGAGNDSISGGAGTDIAKVAGLRASYTLQTVNGQVQLVDNDAADGNDGTDTLVGIETVQFKDQSMGIVSPIILDLTGNGVETLSAGQSRARFDMNGDGVRDDTSWIAATQGFLYLDRDGNGTVSGIGEMSFTADVEGADSDLAWLRAFDSNYDGMISAADDRFEDFGVWRDADGDGTVDRGELLRLSDINLSSIDLTGTATATTLAPGEVALVSTGSWTRTDGTTMVLGDAKMTYFGGVDQSALSVSPSRGGALDTLLSLRDQGFFADRGGWRQWASSIGHAAEVADRPGPGGLRDLSARRTDGLDAQHNPVFASEAAGAGAAGQLDRRVALMTQDLAAFGSDAAGRIELLHDHRDLVLTPNLA